MSDSGGKVVPMRLAPAQLPKSAPIRVLGMEGGKIRLLDSVNQNLHVVPSQLRRLMILSLFGGDVRYLAAHWPPRNRRGHALLFDVQAVRRDLIAIARSRNIHLERKRCAEELRRKGSRFLAVADELDPPDADDDSIEREVERAFELAAR